MHAGKSWPGIRIVLHESFCMNLFSLPRTMKRSGNTVHRPMLRPRTLDASVQVEHYAGRPGEVVHMRAACQYLLETGCLSAVIHQLHDVALRFASPKPGSSDFFSRRVKSSSTSSAMRRSRPVSGSIHAAATPSLAALNLFQVYCSLHCDSGHSPGCARYSMH